MDEKGFKKTLHEFLNDLQTVFPEHRVVLENHRTQVDCNTEYYITWFSKVSDMYFVDITSKNEKIFDRSEPVELLPDLDFTQLWKSNISGNTKNAIWKYLHLLLLYIFKQQTNTTTTFDETLEQWNMMLDDHPPSLTEDTLNQMKRQTEKMMTLIHNLSSKESSSSSSPSLEKLAEDLKDDPFIQRLEQSKIAKLAEELISDGNLPENLMNLIGQEPHKLLDVVKNIGNKIQSKLSSGQLHQQDLLNETQDLLGSIQNSDSLQKIFEGLQGNHTAHESSGGGEGDMPSSPFDLLKTLSQQLSGMTSKGEEGEDEDQEEQQEPSIDFSQMANMMQSMIQSMMKGQRKVSAANQTKQHYYAPSVEQRRQETRERLRKKLVNKKI